MNFTFLYSNIPIAHAYGVYITLYGEWCSWNHPFVNFIVAIMSWLTVMEYRFHTWQWICSNCRNHNPVLFSSNHQMCTYMSNMNDETCIERSTKSYWEPEFTPEIGGVFVAQFFVFYTMKSVNCCFSFFFCFLPCHCTLMLTYEFDSSLCYLSTSTNQNNE